MFQAVAAWLLDPRGLTPHGFCLLWEPGLIWTYALSDTAIAVAYFTIPLALAVFSHRRRDLVFRPIFWLFASFILLCGTTHIFDVLTLWSPAYGLEGAVKVATAAVSVVTAVALWWVLPDALALPSHAQLQDANTALRESEARFRAFFEYSPVPMHILDQNGVILGVSRSWQTLFGYTEAEVIGRRITEFRTPAMTDTPLPNDLGRLRETGEVHDVERRYVRHNGDMIDALVSARLEQRDGETLIVCVLIDVTERRRTEEALRAMEERLHRSQKMEAVGQLTGGIAHDFNNMLQAITGNLDLMERRISQGRIADTGRCIATARKAADSAAALTSRMLAFARRQALQPTILVPGKLLDGIVDLIRTGVGPAVRLELAPYDNWTVACDVSQLENAILNLAFNARDAMPEGGTLKISTASRVLTRTDLLDEDDVPPGEYVEIVVADTGDGMRPDVLRRAFEPFFTTRPFGHGTGLGLSQVYGFVRQSGGFVRLESTVGRGTTVRIFLPHREQLESTTGDTAVRPALSQSNDTRQAAAGAKVLVVEDDERIRSLIVTLLDEQGYAVTALDEGLAGLTALESATPIDLLLTDVGLPGINGRQLAEVGRALRPGLPVLFITGYPGIALTGIELNDRTQILRKPFASDTLIANVRAMIEATPVSSQA